MHYAAHEPIDVAAIGCDVLLCSPYKFCGPHLGIAFTRRELAETWRPYKARPSKLRFETGTLPYELLAGFSATIAYLDTIGGMEQIRTYERELGEQFLAGLPGNVTLYGPPTMEGRVPTFLFNVDGVPADVAAHRLADQGFGVWYADNWYCVVARPAPAGAIAARRHRALQHRGRSGRTAGRSRRLGPSRWRSWCQAPYAQTSASPSLRCSDVSNNQVCTLGRVRRLGLVALALMLFVPASVNAASSSMRAGVFTGYAFDACKAPSTASLQAWAASPYRALGIYIGGTNRACSAAEPHAAVGAGHDRARLEPAAAVRRAAGAVHRAERAREDLDARSRRPRRRGARPPTTRSRRRRRSDFPSGSPIWFDMEGYHVGERRVHRTRCARS